MNCHLNACIDCQFSKFCEEGKILNLKQFQEINKKIDEIDFETVALRKGLKKIVKKEFLTQEQYENYLKDNADLKISISKDNSDAINQGLIGFIASFDENLMKRGNYLEDRMFEALMQKDFSLYKEGGKLLGYPDCCVNKFTNTSFARSRCKLKPYDVDTGYDLLSIKRTQDFFCPLLKLVSNSMLSFHVCAFDCQNAIKNLQNILLAVGERYEIDLNLFFGYLKTPIIYFSNFEYINLIGYLEKNIIYYDGFVDKEKISGFENLGLGNKIYIEEFFGNIYKDDEFIGKIDIKDFLFLNFGHEKKLSNIGKLDDLIKKFL